jgi:hypothetical protein
MVAERDAATTPLWATRLRWRLRGALQWPAFAVCVVADAVLLSALPFAGEGLGIVPAFLLAGFLNLAVVALLAPVAGWYVRRRRPELPRVVAADTAGTALVLSLSVALLAGGLLHRPAVQEAKRDFVNQGLAVRRFVLARAPGQYHANLARADTVKQAPNLFRTCVPGDDPRRAFCVIVNTDQSPPGVQLDPDHRPNATVSGPQNPGRGAR